MLLANMHTHIHLGLTSASVSTCEQRANPQRRFFVRTDTVAMPPCKLSAQRLGSFSPSSACGRGSRDREMWRPLSSDACPSIPNSQLLRHRAWGRSGSREAF